MSKDVNVVEFFS